MRKLRRVIIRTSISKALTMASYDMSIIILASMVMAVAAQLWTPGGNSKPEFSCPANEEYYKCSQIHCYKNCEHLTKPPACPAVSPDCYNPACECIQDYLRNREGICVPYKKCENWATRREMNDEVILS